MSDIFWKVIISLFIVYLSVAFYRIYSALDKLNGSNTEFELSTIRDIILYNSSKLFGASAFALVLELIFGFD